MGYPPSVSLWSKVFDSFELSLDFPDGSSPIASAQIYPPISMIRGSTKEFAKRRRARKVRGCWVLYCWEGLGGLTCDFWAEKAKRKTNDFAYYTPTFDDASGSRLDRRITIPIARAIATFMRTIPMLPAKSDPGNMNSLPRNTAFSVMPGSKEKMYCHARKSLAKMIAGSQIGAFLRVKVK